MSPRKNAPVSVLREAFRLELRAARYSARHAARKVSRKPTRMTLAVAATAAVGAIAAAGAAPWTGAASALTADVGLANSQGSASGSAATGTSASADHSVTGSQSELTSNSARVPFGSASKHALVPAASKPAAKAAPAKPAAKPAPAKHAAPAPSGPTTFYDSVNPLAIPAGQAEAVYADGTFQASWADTAGHKALWIDVHGYNTGANVLDVEPGDASPAGAAAWVSAKLTQTPSATAIIYTFKGDWGEVQADINALPSWMHSHVKYWIADPTGYSHILPGAEATQWYWGSNYDISAANPGFFSK